MSEKREDQRPENEKLWDKTFEDDENKDSQGNLSRVQRRKQDSNNSRITTILVALIIILAAVPIFFWARHKQAFDHPVRTEQTSQTSSKKVASSKKTATKHSKSHKKVASSASTSSATSSESAASSVSTSSTSESSTSSDSKYTTVEAGQGIYRVATNNGLTVSELARLNNISPNTPLQPGQRLRVK
ncbi:SAG1386/EF1546 family surface-associated protein [Limosilactobacillus caecicola]|uniref:SAG1386/EF1546 family surface-associated protein n=1 Tax=Limosilactobacillus caecicola TaxID=2941332 RepID=UPI00203F8275|nr:SAG1386/EF1546 family surface-associated protein [Limosilactobacillus caecicola]